MPAIGCPVDAAGTPYDSGNPLPVVQTGTPAIPTGAATAAKQDTGNTSLASIATLLGGTAAVKDNGPGWASVFGVSGARVTSADASGGINVTDAPTAGQKLVVTDVLVSADTAVRVDFKVETAGTVLASVYLPANGTLQLTFRGKLKLALADKKLQVQTSAAGNIAVTANYYSEA